ncbi:hypothetical protein KK137_09330 [Croceibacterium sp. LX-88]|jgi:hypothetical protein|uniref:Uncharacterized protein n=1 Tax=Croceibacterium selenioxidans TaxID=2838833 RepID=A0ABS5W4A3_9SPHN|nr:hypothetical protein [Croceibacterium selenioxidans]MBT2134534.1 hypothetical protein [Croceibacterium selenioxidans]
MLATLTIVTAMFAVLAILVAAVLWLARSWEVVDDDRKIHRLYREAGLRGWFSRAPRLLTYRRDGRGRFRRHKR